MVPVVAGAQELLGLMEQHCLEEMVGLVLPLTFQELARHTPVEVVETLVLPLVRLGRGA
jgi:hypothetical protein